MMEDKVKEQPKLSSQQLRKIKKPMIERRRRERINDSLNQLKALVLEAMNKEESRYSKMEKADILEMTVKHLKQAQRQTMPLSSVGVEQNLVGKYRTGFAECAQEVERYLSTFEELPPEVRMRLMGHLSGCVDKKIPAAQVAASLAARASSGSPEATQLTSLPGAAQSPIQLSVNTTSPTPAQVPSVSPVLPLSPAAMPAMSVTTLPASTPMIVMSPTSSSQTHTGVFKDAIPLYFAAGSQRPTSHVIARDSSPVPPRGPSPDTHHHTVFKQAKEVRGEEHYRASIPPQRCHQEQCYRTEEPRHVKRASTYPVLPRAVECKPIQLPVWRPW